MTVRVYVRLFARTKIAVYRAVVTTLLYGCETWTLYRHQIRKLDQFHMRCLRSIARIKRRDKVPNTDVLRICDITGIEAMLLQAQLCWVGHVVRMPDIRIPQQVFYGELEAGRRLPGGPVKRYKTNLKACGITARDINTAPLQRNSWRSRYQTAVASF